MELYIGLADGCREGLLILRGGRRPLQRIRSAPGAKRCMNCGTPGNSYHHYGCHEELCPICKTVPLDSCWSRRNHPFLPIPKNPIRMFNNPFGKDPLLFRSDNLDTKKKVIKEIKITELDIPKRAMNALIEYREISNAHQIWQMGPIYLEKEIPGIGKKFSVLIYSAAEKVVSDREAAHTRNNL